MLSYLQDLSNMTGPVAIVLGGTTPHAMLVQKLKGRGFYVVLIDYLDDPPAKKFADQHVKESTLNKEKVLEIAKRVDASLVISTCIDQANSVCCYVAEKLGLPLPYSYATSLDVTDKGLMKRIMIDNAIPTSPYTLTDSVDNIEWSKVEFPAVVKPVDCNSSKGVRRVDSKEDTIQSVSDALELSRTHKAIIEGYNQGEEIQVDCVSTSAGVEVVLTRQKQKINSNDSQMVLQSRGSLFPAPLTNGLNEQVQDIAKRIAFSFGLKNTPFFYQAIVTEKGVRVLEFAPRIGGGLSYFVIKKLTGFDVLDAAIDSFLGKEILFQSTIISKCYSTSLLYMLPGTFDHVEGLQNLKDSGFAEEIFVMKNKGAVVDNDMRSSNRIAAFLLSADTYEELVQKEKTAIRCIEIKDICGNNLMNRAIYNI